MTLDYTLNGASIDRFQSVSASGFTNYLVSTVPLSGRSCSIDHRLFRSPHDVDVLSSYATFYASFWKGAPARRSVLFVKPSLDRRPFVEVYPDTPEPVWGGVRYTDRDTAETAILFHELDSRPLRFVDGSIVGARRAATSVLEQICAERRAIFFPAGNRDLRKGNAGLDGIDVVVPLGRYGDRISRQSAGGLAFNSGFFVWTDEEFGSDPTARVPDPLGLTVESGRIVTPPIYSRPILTLGQKPEDARVLKLSIADCSVGLGGQEFSGAVAMTRVSARRGPLPPIPAGQNRISVSGSTVVGVVASPSKAHPAGGGFFLDVPVEVAESALVNDSTVVYEIPAIRGAWAACQGAIELLRNDEIVDLEAESALLDLPCRGGVIGEVPPNHLTPSALLAPGLARTAVGIVDQQSLVVVHAEGTELRSADPRFDSEGATLLEIAHLLKKLGCTAAVAFDGGGSAVVAADGRLLVAPSDRFDVRHLPRERIAPGGWLVEGT